MVRKQTELSYGLLWTEWENTWKDSIRFTCCQVEVWAWDLWLMKREYYTLHCDAPHFILKSLTWFMVSNICTWFMKLLMELIFSQSHYWAHHIRRQTDDDGGTRGRWEFLWLRSFHTCPVYFFLWHHLMLMYKNKYVWCQASAMV